MSPEIFRRSAPLLVLCILLLVACGDPAGDALEPTGEPGPAATPEPANEAEPIPSAFLAEGLHDIVVPPPGQFRLEVAGEVFEGRLDEPCGWGMRQSEGANQDRFTASSWQWTTDDGRRMTFDLGRLVMYDEFFWNRSHGHEVDQVTLRIRADEGGSLQQIEETAWSRMHLLRPAAGDEVSHRMGGGEMPAIRVAEDGLRATAAGELQASDWGEPDAYGDPLTGDFSLAVHCSAG
ncbi:MAG: hypothetical protein EA351_09500 [Gemmatimonadales bacterium]|nr:MAG: hypothetical protein EA351_09500 [Gemmatimonadales bacterium]